MNLIRARARLTRQGLTLSEPIRNTSPSPSKPSLFHRNSDTTTTNTMSHNANSPFQPQNLDICFRRCLQTVKTGTLVCENLTVEPHIAIPRPNGAVRQCRLGRKSLPHVTVLHRGMPSPPFFPFLAILHCNLPKSTPLPPTPRRPLPVPKLPKTRTSRFPRGTLKLHRGLNS
jgi:hypothetical protein